MATSQIAINESASEKYIQFGSQRIDFSLIYKERKTLGITVRPDRSVMVKAPVDASLDQIMTKVRKRAPWIIKQQSFFLSFEPRTPARRYIGGETHLYLGRQYRIKYIHSQNPMVKLKGAYLEVHTDEKSNIKSLVKAWYKQKANLHFIPLCEKWIEQFKLYDIHPSGIQIKEMSNRWGSCTPTGKIILNTELIQAPKKCIEYVIIHELCHLVHYNHSKAFFELQDTVFPDWKVWKEKLERVMG